MNYGCKRPNLTAFFPPGQEYFRRESDFGICRGTLCLLYKWRVGDRNIHRVRVIVRVIRVKLGELWKRPAQQAGFMLPVDDCSPVRERTWSLAAKKCCIWKSLRERKDNYGASELSRSWNIPTEDLQDFSKFFSPSAYRWWRKFTLRYMQWFP